MTKRHNQQGQRSETTAPVIVDKPDLRHYNRKKAKVQEDTTAPERREYVRRRRQVAREVHTRWKATHGVVDRFGDLVRIYTGACQADRCTRWFMVERTPGDVEGRWPSYCSTACGEAMKAKAGRRTARKIRAGKTSGKRKPEVSEFDPDYWMADAIVRGRISATDGAVAAAWAYLDEVPEERPDHWSDYFRVATWRDFIS